MMLKKLIYSFLKLFLFWILIFDFGRILFTIHNWDKFGKVTFLEIIQSFIYSFRLDLAAASALNVLPIIFLFLFLVYSKKVFKMLFMGIIIVEIVALAMIQCGEINAYGEWNHKLTSRVFMHLANPDEVFRSADYWMTFWFFVYLILEIAFSWKLLRCLFKNDLENSQQNSGKWYLKFTQFFAAIVLSFGLLLVFLRGGFQQIPININSAIFSNSSVANDLSMNSLYFFTKSFLLYNRSEIDGLMPKINPERAKKLVAELYNYPKEHDCQILANQKPNIVFVVLEGWAAEGIGAMSDTKNSTTIFDKLAKEGVLFTQVYSTSHTSEIGNASIFSGFPGIPEVSISMQPEKSRKLKSINQSLKTLNYSSAYLFGGDLKYGNIGGYFMDHGFDVVKDENDFSGIENRGKLNVYDEDLYTKFISEINATQEPFMHATFTGSTHSPYDIPKTRGQNFTGNEADYMNSLVYADQCIGKFIENAKKQAWFKNTLFVFVADHGHATPNVASAIEGKFYRIPLLFWGPVLNKESQGLRINKIGSQADIAATLLHQLKIKHDEYVWSRDLLNPNVTEFAFHTIIRGYGWRSPGGHLTYQMEMKKYLEDSFDKKIQAQEKEKCNAFLTQVYEYYKEL